MAHLTRSHYNLIGDATADLIALAKDLFADDADKAQAFASAASHSMTNALAGTNSQFKADRFRERCLGKKGPR